MGRPIGGDRARLLHPHTMGAHRERAGEQGHSSLVGKGGEQAHVAGRDDHRALRRLQVFRACPRYRRDARPLLPTGPGSSSTATKPSNCSSLAIHPPHTRPLHALQHPSTHTPTALKCSPFFLRIAPTAHAFMYKFPPPAIHLPSSRPTPTHPFPSNRASCYSRPATYLTLGVT